MKLHRGKDLKFVIALILFLSSTIGSVTFAQSSYDIGSPTLTDIWVDPVLGSDSNTGDTRDQALLTVTAAWGKVPQGVPLTETGYRIKLVAGDYPESSFPTYWESRYGTYQFPVILEAADGPLSSRIHAYLNIYDVRYLYLVGLSFVTDRGYGGGGNVVHVEQGDHFLIRGCKLNGNDGAMNQPQETLKVNQSQYFYVEDSDIGGAFWFALDFVSVVYGHVVGNRIHDVENDCVVLKGGVAYVRIEGNEVDHCGVIGLGAGQGTGFNWMVSPWLHYEAYDLKFINNVVHHVANAGLAVRGGYNILFAYNTLYGVGTAENGSALFLASPGARSCDGDTPACQSRHLAGGWGPPSNGDGGEWIPNRNVFVYNNVFYNPAPYRTQSAHLGVFGPVNPPADTNTPSPSYSDTNLQIRGNVIWNGPTDLPLGIEESDQGCQPANPTCNLTQLLADNTINTLEPQLINPENGNFRPVEGGNVFGATTYNIPDFTWNDAPSPPNVPQGNLSNQVPLDRDKNERTSSGPAGAYTSGATPPTRFTLTVTKGGSGIGSVVSTPTGINCGSDCTEAYQSGTAVTLTTTPVSGSTFEGWSGVCSGTGQCSVTMDAHKTVTATFNQQQYTLTVTKAGTGSGTVTSSPTGINCGSDCSEAYNEGTDVILTATASASSTFTGWSGACSGTGSCSVTMSSNKTVTAAFAQQPQWQYTLTVSKTGTGTGTVTSSPSGINCGSDCSEAYNGGTNVTLTATASAGSTFAGWSGACSDTGQCSVTMDADKTVTGTFNQQQYTLMVTKAGTGSGTVTSNPSGIDCGSDCSETYNHGTSVTLTATPVSGSTFEGWSGDADCSDGVVLMNVNKTCTATFNPQVVGYTLTVIKSGTGSGTVTSSPAGINCGSDCSETYTKVQKVKLTAKADTNSTFTGWEGGSCSGTKTCTVTVDATITLTASFELKTPDISVAQTTLDFGSIKVGKKKTKTLKITNNGTGDLVITLLGLEGTGFSIQGSSSVTIKGKKSYSLKVLFVPTSSGLEAATLMMSSNDPDTPTLGISLSGTGQ